MTTQASRASDSCISSVSLCRRGAAGLVPPPVVPLTLFAAVVRQSAPAAALELLAGVGLPDPARCALAFGELVVNNVDGRESDRAGYLPRRPVLRAPVDQQGERVGLPLQRC